MLEYLKKVVSVFVKSVPSDSPTGKINTTDLAKITRTAILMGVSTSVTHWLANVNPEMFGEYSAIAAIVLTLLGEASIRFLKGK